jgi:hypothetical protein
MAITFEQLMDNLSRDPWTGEKLAPDFSKLFALTCGDYQKWLRRQIRQYGRRAVVGNVQHHPIDLFVKERTGLDFTMLAGGEVEVTVDGKTYEFMTEAVSLAYYIFDDDGQMITTAGKALDMALEDASTLIVDREY